MFALKFILKLIKLVFFLYLDVSFDKIGGKKLLANPITRQNKWFRKSHVQWPREKEASFQMKEMNKSALRIPDKSDDLQTCFVR